VPRGCLRRGRQETLVCAFVEEDFEAYLMRPPPEPRARSRVAAAERVNASADDVT